MAENGYGNPVKRFKRRRKDTIGFWASRHRALLKAGFSEAEARWGANHGLALRNKQVQGVLRHRKALVAWFMRYGHTREEAIEAAAKDLESKLDRIGEEELNLFYEISP